MPVMEGKAHCLNACWCGFDSPCFRYTRYRRNYSNGEIFGSNLWGINLEDISAPRCFEIEQRLIDELDIPVFHDDQHGTAIVVLAALYNSLKLINKKIEDIHVVINGGGSAGLSITRKFLGCWRKTYYHC